MSGTGTVELAGSGEPRLSRRQQDFWIAYDAFVGILLLAVASSLLARSGLSSPIWLLCYLLVLFRIVLVWKVFAGVLFRARAYFLYPAVCLSSVLWSLDPKVSLISSVQLGVTVLFGVFLGWRYSQKRLMKFLFAVSFLGGVLSLLHWATGVFPWPKYSLSGGFVGFYPNKNILAQQVTIGALAATTLLLTPHDRTRRSILLAGLVLSPFLVALTSSATALLLMPAFMGLTILLSVHRIPPRIVLLGGGLVVSMFSIVPLGMVLAGFDPITAVLDATGKDATLTGRTLIWQVAAQEISERPFVGAGFLAFWSAPEFANDRLLIVHAGAVTSASVHNFVLEILIGTGVVGMAAMAVTLVAALGASLRSYRMTRSVPAAGATTIIGAAVAFSLLTPGLYRPHEMFLLVVVALGMSAAEDVRFHRWQRAQAGSDGLRVQTRKGTRLDISQPEELQ